MKRKRAQKMGRDSLVITIQSCIREFNKCRNLHSIRGCVFYFVSRRFASRIHEISDLKKKLSCSSLRAGYTMLRDKKKTY